MLQVQSISVQCMRIDSIISQNIITLALTEWHRHDAGQDWLSSQELPPIPSTCCLAHIAVQQQQY